MPVSRLKSRRDLRQEGGIARLRDTILDAADVVPVNVLDRVVHLLDRELSSRRGWRFVMVEPNLFHDLILRLTADGASARPAVAVRVLTSLFRWLPPDGNEVDASRSDIAAAARCRPEEVSRAMRELEAIGPGQKGRAVGAAWCSGGFRSEHRRDPLGACPRHPCPTWTPSRPTG